MNPIKWQTFLSEVRSSPIRKDALDKAGVLLPEFHDHMRNDPTAQREFAEAFDAGIDSLEDEAMRRALYGVEEPVYGKDGLLGYKTVYANDLMKMILQAHRKKYRGEGDERGALSQEARQTLGKVFAEWVTAEPAEKEKTEKRTVQKAEAAAKEPTAAEKRRAKLSPTKTSNSAKSRFK